MMSDAEVKAIAATWDQMQWDRNGAEDQNSWAYEKLYDLCIEVPQDAWRVIRELLALNPNFSTDIEQLARIAAGPIEDLLSYHGDLFIAEFEKLSKEDRFFQKVLGGVWRRGMTDEIWT